MITALKTILSSKKWLMTIVAAAAVGIMQHFGVSHEIIAIVGSLFGVGVLGQGMADLGKEAKK